jgi:hypothetical protein
MLPRVKKRQAMIGYITYMVIKAGVRRQVRKKVGSFTQALETTPKRRIGKFPLIGAALGLAAGAAAVLFARQRQSPE